MGSTSAMSKERKKWNKSYKRCAKDKRAQDQQQQQRAV